MGSYTHFLLQSSDRTARTRSYGVDQRPIMVECADASICVPKTKRSLGLIYTVSPSGASHQSSERDWMVEKSIAFDLYMDQLAGWTTDDIPAYETLQRLELAWAA
jgi:hypothetical protein